MVSLCLGILLRAPNFDTRVTEELKDVLASEAVAAVAKDASVDWVYPKGYENVKISVFARDIPARSLLDRVASTIGFVGSIQDGKYVLVPGAEFKGQTLRDYIYAEAAETRQILLSRLFALANLTWRPFGSNQDPVSGSDSDPKVWASRRIDQPAYYALGMAFRVGPIQKIGGPVGLASADLCLEAMIDRCIAFRVGTPTEKPTQSTFIDANSSAIEGTLVACGALPSTAEIKISVVSGSPVRAEPLSKLPYLFAAPPESLRKEKFVQLLSQWRMTPKEVASAVQATPIETGLSPTDSGYFDGRTSLSDQLQRIHLQTGIPIVATSFRTPSIGQQPAGYSDKAAAIESLSTDEKCFLRAEDGVLLVRHPAYWLLRWTEPSEQVIRQCERIAATRALTLDEYADLAYSLSRISDPGAVDLSKGGSGVPHSFDRIENLRGLLLRFDGSPLATAYPPLYFMGCLGSTDREALLGGAPWGAAAILREAPNRWRGSVARAPSDVASLAPMFDAAIGLRYLTPAESGADLITAYDAAFHRDVDQHTPLVNTLEAESLGLRARYVWLETLGPTEYAFRLGFKDMTTATYTVRWTWRPPKQPDPDDDGGGR